MITPQEFLESEGLPLRNISFIAFFDGCQRSPDLLLLFEKYAELRIAEEGKESEKRIDSLIKMYEQ